MDKHAAENLEEAKTIIEQVDLKESGVLVFTLDVTNMTSDNASNVMESFADNMNKFFKNRFDRDVPFIIIPSILTLEVVPKDAMGIEVKEKEV